MPLTDIQRERIEEAHQTAAQCVYKIQRAIGHPLLVIYTIDEIDTDESAIDAVAMVNESKGRAIALCDELKAYLQSLPDLS